MVGQLLAVPPDQLTTASPSEATPTASYLAYGWGGAASANLNGSLGPATPAWRPRVRDGLQTLAVSSSSFTDTVGTAATPQATLTANPTTVAAEAPPSSRGATSGRDLPGGQPRPRRRLQQLLVRLRQRDAAGDDDVPLLRAHRGGRGASPLRPSPSAVAAVPTINSFTASALLVNPSGLDDILLVGLGRGLITLNGTDRVRADRELRVAAVSATTQYTLVATAARVGA